MSRVLRLFLPVLALLAGLIGLSDIQPAQAASASYAQPPASADLYDGYRVPSYTTPRAAPRKAKRHRATAHRHVTRQSFTRHNVTRRHVTGRHVVTRIGADGRVYTVRRVDRPVIHRTKAQARQEARRKAQARQRIADRRFALEQAEFGREIGRAQARGATQPAPRLASLGDVPSQPRLSSLASNVEARIDIASQRMIVSVDGEVRHVWKVSTGRKGFSTPRGAYKPQRMHVRYFSRKYYNSPMPYSIFFRGGYAIHGTTAIDRLGGPASHGCVRLATGNARTLFNLVRSAGPARTRIVIS